VKQVLAPVVSNAEVAQGTYLLRLHVPEIAAHARPGQFVHVRCAPVWARPTNPDRPSPQPSPIADAFAKGEGVSSLAWDPLLRRPLSIMRTHRESGEIEILYDVVGRGTALLSRARPGEALDVLGPLGRPFELKASTRQALLVGGGGGVPPLVALAEEALAKGVSVTLVAGFRTAAKVFPAELLPPEVEYVVTTDDGSAGRPGLVTEPLAEYLCWADQLFACGPLPMLKALARLDLPCGLPVQISMEERMGCAMGVCLGCVVRTRHGLQRVCRDGPVFDLRELDLT